MKTAKKVLAVVLCMGMLCGLFGMNSSASFLTSSLTGSRESIKEFGNKINDIIQSVVKAVVTVYPRPRTWKSLDDYDSSWVYDEADGRKTYSTEPAEGAQWKVGYASESLIPDDMAPGKYYLGRQLNFFASGEQAKADGVLDDQRVRVICLDDGSGRGAVVFAVIDGLGVGSGTIRAIRRMLGEYVADGRIAAINVSATHCHSALDTQGVSTSLSYVLLANSVTNMFGLEKASTSNDPFMDRVINATVRQVKSAYESMETGKLYYDKTSISEYSHDKREYISREDMPDVGILHFVPDNADSRPTYFVNLTCHPTNTSAKAKMASGDYPFYIDYMIKKAGANFVMTQGAVGQISGKGISVDSNGTDYLVASKELKLEEKLGKETYDKSNAESADKFGEKMAEIILAAKEDGEEELTKPVINAKYAYTQFTTDNYTLNLACKCRLVDNEVYTTGSGVDDVCLPSEVGYVEFGDRVAFGLFPCEFYPEVFHGQDIITNDKENYAWNDSEWNIPAAKDMVRSGIDVYAVCFANDYIGYVVPDNYYSGWGHWSVDGSDVAYFEYDPNESVFEYVFGGTADQLLSAGKQCASQIMGVFRDLVSGLGNRMR